jgi:hypothetical protein
VKISPQLSQSLHSEVKAILEENCKRLTTIPSHPQSEEQIITLTTNEHIDERKAKRYEMGKQRSGSIQKNKGTNVQTTDPKNHRLQKDKCTFNGMTPILDSGQLYAKNMKDCYTQTDTRMWSLIKSVDNIWRTT